MNIIKIPLQTMGLPSACSGLLQRDLTDDGWLGSLFLCPSLRRLPHAHQLLRFSCGQVRHPTYNLASPLSIYKAPWLPIRVLVMVHPVVDQAPQMYTYINGVGDTFANYSGWSLQLGVGQLADAYNCALQSWFLLEVNLKLCSYIFVAVVFGFWGRAF